jgi:hypothetical protein
MKTFTFVMLSSAAAIAGCSDEADIGVDSDPITCSDVGTADVAGHVTDPFTNAGYDFDSATPTAFGATTGGGPTLQLAGAVDNPDQQASLLLRFSFYCGPAELAKYGVRGDTQEGLDCPLQVASAVLGRIEYLPAETGTLIVDDNANCLAGRFRVDFGSHGAIGGSFAAPWTQQ